MNRTFTKDQLKELVNGTSLLYADMTPQIPNSPKYLGQNFYTDDHGNIISQITYYDEEGKKHRLCKQFKEQHLMDQYIEQYRQSSNQLPINFYYDFGEFVAVNLGGMCKESHNYYTLLDKDSYQQLSQHRMTQDIQKHGKQIYAIITQKDANKRIHQMILDNQNNRFIIDHCNGVTLDNRKCNLRLVDGSVNAINIPKRPSKLSIQHVQEYQYKGQTYYRGVFKYMKKVYQKSKVKSPESLIEIQKWLLDKRSEVIGEDVLQLCQNVE